MIRDGKDLLRISTKLFRGERFIFQGLKQSTVRRRKTFAVAMNEPRTHRKEKESRRHTVIQQIRRTEGISVSAAKDEAAENEAYNCIQPSNRL